MVSNATLEMLAHFIPPIESTSLDFDPTWEETACAAVDVDVGGEWQSGCVSHSGRVAEWLRPPLWQSG